MSQDMRIRSEDLNSRSGKKRDYGPFVGVVVNNYDSLYSGRLQVWIANFGGQSTEPTSWHTVSYANPFYGISPYSSTAVITGRTGAADARASDRASMPGYSADDPTQNMVTTFGMWTQPPAIGTRVLVVFADGDSDKGYWIAAIPEVAHGMIPANAAGKSGMPEAEFDPASIQVQTTPDIRTVQRPELSDVAQTYETQGLTDDPLRGIITSSSFRESPSQVMGFSTPKGHTFVMDDGDENSQSKLIRIRTKNGNQITLHDDTGMIYFVNAEGTSWMEMGASGQVDVYGETGISFATKGDINFHADGNFNMHSNKATKIVAGTGAKIQGTQELQLHGSKLYLEGVNSVEMHSCGELKITSFKDIFIKGFNFLVAQAKCFRWNSGTAKEAEQVPPEKNKSVSGYQTTVDRAPSREPYDQHDRGSVIAGDSQADLPAAGAAEASGNNEEGNLLDLAVQAGLGYLTGGVTGAVAAATGMDKVITVATRAEAIALARYAPPGTIINYGTAGRGIRTGSQLFETSTSLGGISASLASRISGNSITVPTISGFNLLRNSTTQGVSTGDITAIAGGAVGGRLTNGSVLGTIVGSIAGRLLTEATAEESARAQTSENAIRFVDSTGSVPLPPTRSIDSDFSQPTRPGQQFSGIIPTPPTRPADSASLSGSVDGPRPSAAYPTTSLAQSSVSSAQTEGSSGNYLGQITSEPQQATPVSLNSWEQNAGASPTSPKTYSLNSWEQNAGSVSQNNTSTNADGSPANPAIASQQLSGAGAATSIPAVRGGGVTGNFARGDNCGRPSGQGAGSSTTGPYAPGGKGDPVREQEMYDYLTKEKGLTHEQAVGFIANTQAESGYRADAVGDNGNSIGLVQYNAAAGRAQPFEAAVPDWRTNWKGQIDYILDKDPTGVQYKSLNFSSSGDAASWFTYNFERPADTAGQAALRGSYASRIDSTIQK